MDSSRAALREYHARAPAGAVLLDQRPLQVGPQHLVVAEGLAVVLGGGEQLLLLEFVENLSAAGRLEQ